MLRGMALGAIAAIAVAFPAHAQTSSLGGAIAALTDQLSAFATSLFEGESLSVWLGAQFEAPQGQIWVDLAWITAVAVIVGWGLAFVSRLALSSTIRRVEVGEARVWWVRIPMALGRFLLVSIPAVVFAAVGAGVLVYLAPDDVVRQGALTFISFVTAAWLGVALAKAIFAPLVPSLRPVPLGDAQAVYLFVWSRRLINVLVFSAVVVEIAEVMAMPQSATLLLAKALGLVVALLIVTVILQSRATVGQWIEGEKGGPAGWRLFRARLGDVWHVLAILYVATAWTVWTIAIPGGFDFVAGNTASTAAIVAVAWVASWATRLGLQRLFGIGKQIRARYPFVTERANLYLPMVRRILVAVIQVIAGLTILRVWGLDVWSLLATDLGRALSERAIGIAVILAVALLAWEASSAAIRIYMERTDDDGQPIVRSKRARTLLPLIRNALLVLIGVMTAMVILAELGVSIGPLLAGAGVAGLAVGFGAQTLVKDFITGMFILIEDSIHVGDVVRVAGKAGTVEALTVRTVRMRDLGGVVHTVPFSSVDVIENMTKEYSQAVIDVGVGYRENYDEVVEVLKAISEDMRADPDLGPKILEPMLVLGLNELADSAVMIRVRIKTEPSQQWAMRREFNRRVKQRFDELGIEIPYPHRTVYFGEDAQGNAPPLRHRAEPKP
ncbi:MAG: mechanosensitive ion channel [Alphaproteobacteria bacterium]|nr:mechanosensitive ion channel [Alphaproteobacteria bacterium]